MTNPKLTGNQIRQMFIDFFVQRGHTLVPSSSLVPGGDATLLFTNAGMVQFKDVFLGTDKRPYNRAVDSQKCMRVAGKHNDLDEVGRDDIHHTFFEMLGNWSFGDYYKKEAIAWAWELLTEVWGLPKERLWATCFKDDQGAAHGIIPTDEEAAENWCKQPGFDPTHVVYCGRKDNLWEMAETGPCGPCSEVNIDWGLEACERQGVPGHVCRPNGDCKRFTEFWNLVFIQYNRLSPNDLRPLPATHVDTGMGLDRIVAILQGVGSNYRTDLFWPLIQVTQQLASHSDAELEAAFTSYRVIADHARAAAFLIADGVVPGNTGRNYVTRMIIRRAARFGNKIGMNKPFLASVAEKVIENYGDFYLELKRNRTAILDGITREEKRFQRTVEGGMARLDQIILGVNKLIKQTQDTIEKAAASQLEASQKAERGIEKLTQQTQDTIEKAAASQLEASQKAERGIEKLIQQTQDTIEKAAASQLEASQKTMNGIEKWSQRIIPGDQVFDLYATYGLPLEITRDIAREHDLDVDEAGFLLAMDEHRLASGAGEAMGALGGEDVDIYRPLLADLQAKGLLGPEGVVHDPYSSLAVEGTILALVVDGQSVPSAQPGEKVEVILPGTGFYVESGGQVSDTGTITALTPQPPLPHSGRGGEGGEGVWQIRIDDMRKPAAGVIVHVGEVIRGEPKVGDMALASVNTQRRRDIMRNHTATHLLHAELRKVLGDHARQAGSLVAPDRLRFDFTHPDAVSPDQLERIEAGVNHNILANYALHTTHKPLQQAISEGATALFGEKYGETVRNITIARLGSSSSSTAGQPDVFSNELCGGTHVAETGDIGICLIVSEGSVASGVRRIEAVTGRGAYELIQRRFRVLKETASLFTSSPEEIPQKARIVLDDLNAARKQISALRQQLALIDFLHHLEHVSIIQGVPVLAVEISGADADTLRQMTDRFRHRYPGGVAVLASVSEGKPTVIAAVAEDLVKRGLNAVELVKSIAAPLGGGGGGRPTLAQAGGKDSSKLGEALASVAEWVEMKLKG